jgi:signal transduction histidine kinase
VAVALLLVGVPLGVALRTVLTTRALDVLQREAEQAQLLLGEQAVSVQGVAVLLDAFARQSGTRLTLLDRRPGVSVQIDTGAPPSDELFFEVDGDLTEAAAGRVGRVATGGLLAVSVPVRGTGGVRQVLRATVTDTALRQEVRAAWLAITGLGLVALGVAALLALRQGARLAAPLEQLAVSARRLGDGDFSVRAPHSGLPEPDEVAAALDATAVRLGTLVERSRSFGADASHQLRTPLTALRLHLDALEAAPDRAAVAAAQVEADRLEATIDELLTLTHPAGEAEPIDLGALVRERVDSWRALAAEQGRPVVVQLAALPPVRARGAAIGQSLQVLLDNALLHGGGTITVSAQPAGGGVRLCVADEGPDLPENRVPENRVPENPTAPGGGGRGLPLARALVEAEGGRLSIERGRPGAMVCLLLPVGGPPPSTPSSRRTPS